MANKRVESSRYWTPPIGWSLRGAGVWTPNDYKPDRWELPTPPVRTSKEARVEYLKCRHDKHGLKYFALHYLWTVDVDDPTGTNVRKFPAYPYLQRFFDEVQKPQNTHVEKSRQMIMSWAWMAVILYDVLFHPRWTDLVISKRAKDVDDGGAESTIDSNFGKLRFMHTFLPEHLWMRFNFKRFMIANPELGSHVKGETGKGSAASRGPTFRRALMDEAAYIERGETVFKGVRQAAKIGTVLNSTPNGKGDVFARIRFSASSTFLKLRYHWTEHPRKSHGLYCECGWRSTHDDRGRMPIEQFHAHHCAMLDQDPPRQGLPRSPWYDEQAQDMRPEDIASELDISYDRSRRGAVWTAFDSRRNVWQVMHKVGPRRAGGRAHETEDDYRLRYLKAVIDPELPFVVGWDFGVGDPAVIMLGQVLDDSAPRIRILDMIQESDKAYSFFATIINTVWRPAADGVGNRHAFRHYGGKDVKNRDSKLESWYSNLRLEGITVEYTEFGGMLDWIDYINGLYADGGIEISDWCSGLLDAVQNYHYPTDSDGNRLPGQQLPTHDEWSHANDALRGIVKVRYAGKLLNRKKLGVPTRRILARGGGYDKTTESRIY